MSDRNDRKKITGRNRDRFRKLRARKIGENGRSMSEEKEKAERENIQTREKDMLCTI